MNKILEKYMILSEVQNHILKDTKLNYVFIFNCEYVVTTKEPSDIISILKVCDNNDDITEENIDLYIEEDRNIKSIVENYKVMSWHKFQPYQKIRPEIDFVNWKKRRDKKYEEYLKKERVK